MSGSVSRLLDNIALMGREQRVLHTFVAVAPVLVLLCAWLAGANRPLWVTVVVLGLTGACLLEPDGHSALVTTAFLGWFWFAYVDRPTTLWAMPAAMALAMLHVASAVSSTSPVSTAVPPGYRSLWQRRLALLAGTSAASWLLAGLPRAVRAAGDAALTVTALLLIGGVALWLRRSATEPE